jgi:uncharacterized protein YqhQ
LAKFYYGGQAVIEGVMMRGQRHMAVAVRAPGGDIVVHEEALNSAIYRHPIMKLPFLRGFVALWDALGLGIKALMFSADVAMQEEVRPKDVGKLEGLKVERLEGPGPATSENENFPTLKPSNLEANQKAFSGPAAWTSIALALAMMVGLFFVLPVLAASFVTGLLNVNSSLAHNVIEGVIRLGLFLGYIWAIGKMRDIERVFGYHGAEHKTINAFEAGEELTPERVQRFTLLNPRCGTTFLLIVLLLATVVFVLIGKLPFVLMVLSRVVLVPIIAAAAYEFIRLMANLYHHAAIRAILAPALALQNRTTRQPDLSMIEVGIAALKAVLVADGVMPAVPAPARQVAEGSRPEPVAALVRNSPELEAP